MHEAGARGEQQQQQQQQQQQLTGSGAIGSSRNCSVTIMIRAKRREKNHFSSLQNFKIMTPGRNCCSKWLQRTLYIESEYSFINVVKVLLQLFKHVGAVEAAVGAAEAAHLGIIDSLRGIHCSAL